MLVQATPMRECGKALEHYEVQKAPGVRGDTIVVLEKSTALNRYPNIARFQVSGVNDAQPMPPLHDALHLPQIDDQYVALTKALAGISSALPRKSLASFAPMSSAGTHQDCA